MPFVSGFLHVRESGRPDNGLPDAPDFPSNELPGNGGGGNIPGHLPSPPPGIWPPISVSHPIQPTPPGTPPGVIWPPVGGRPDQGLPGAGGTPGKPSQGLPGAPDQVISLSLLASRIKDSHPHPIKDSHHNPFRQRIRFSRHLNRKRIGLLLEFLALAGGIFPLIRHCQLAMNFRRTLHQRDKQ